MAKPPGQQPDGFNPETLMRRGGPGDSVPQHVSPHTLHRRVSLMARKRMLSPEMFTSSTVSAWSAATRWTWAGMLCYLDDFGYGEDSPALIKAAVWPRDESYTSRKVAADVTQIVSSGTLCRYSCCDKSQLHAPRWDAWQKVSHPTPTRCCPCPSHSGSAHEIHRSLSGTAPPSLVQENSIEGSSSDGSANQPPEGLADHTADKCPAAQFCKYHRKQATA